VDKEKNYAHETGILGKEKQFKN